MARIRSVHPNIWSDVQFVELSVKARAGLLALGTFSDYADRFEWDESKMATHAGPWIIDTLEELVSSRLVGRDGDMGEIFFTFGFRRRRISMWEALRSAVFERDKRACRYCGSTAHPLHCDHIVPVSRGGGDQMENLATSCAPCNLSKNDKLLEEWSR